MEFEKGQVISDLNLSASPQLYDSSYFTIRGIPVLKWQDIWKWGGIIAVLLENTTKHRLQSNMARINNI